MSSIARSRRKPILSIRRFAIGAAFAVGLAAGNAHAADEQVRLELNKSEEQGSGCRLYLVLDNGTDTNFDGYKLDLVLFGKDGVIARRLALDVAPLRPRKKTVKLFDVASLACPALGSILVNDILSCKAGATEPANCIDAVAVESRTPIALMK
jgi:hypothetical protein